MRARFLISRLSALGDVVCSLPVAGALKRGFPDCEVVWYADPRFSALVDRCAFVDKVVLASPKVSPTTWPKPEGEFDAALDVQGLFKSAIIVGRSRAKRKVGFHWQREAAGLFSSPVTPDPTSAHVVDQYVDVARAVGGVAARAEFGLSATQEDRQHALSLLAESGIEGDYAVLNPTSAHAAKRWPPSSFAELAAKLHAEGLRCVVIGGKAPADLEAAEAAVRAGGQAIVSLAGKTNLGALVALIEGCKFHVGGDTGSTHIAAALNRPAIGLYSATDPQRTCPYGQIGNCLYEPTGMAQISVEAVRERISRALR